MKLVVIAVGTEHQMNLGYIARTAKNFGACSLRLVKPKCKVGKTAIKYSKHGANLLKKCKTYNTISEAAKGTLSVATTAISNKSNASSAYGINELLQLIKKNRQEYVSIVIGRESTGLMASEIRECDACTTLELGSDYNTLNISHALAILLYKFSEKLYAHEGQEYPKSELDNLLLLFRKSVNKPNIREKEMVFKAFERILKRANPTKNELKTLAIAFSGSPRKRKRK